MTTEGGARGVPWPLSVFDLCFYATCTSARHSPFALEPGCWVPHVRYLSSSRSSWFSLSFSSSIVRRIGAERNMTCLPVRFLGGCIDCRPGILRRGHCAPNGTRAWYVLRMIDHQSNQGSIESNQRLTVRRPIMCKTNAHIAPSNGIWRLVYERSLDMAA